MGKNNSAAVEVELYKDEKYYISPSVMTVGGFQLTWSDLTVMLDASCSDIELGDEILKAASFAFDFIAGKEDYERNRQAWKEKNTYWGRIRGIGSHRAFVKKSELVALLFSPGQLEIKRYFSRRQTE